MANFKEMERVWNDWIDSHHIDEDVLSKGIDLLEAVAGAFVEEDNFSSIKDAVGKVDTKREFGPKAMQEYQKLLDFIEKNRKD